MQIPVVINMPSSLPSCILDVLEKEKGGTRTGSRASGQKKPVNVTTCAYVVIHHI